MDILGLDHYHVPTVCEGCGGVMIFKGVGEYECEKCGNVAYDDYGKVRLYIEQNRGANAAEIEKGTGVSQRSIRRLLREDRIEVSADSKVFLTCEACGKIIRSGRFCQECEMKNHRSMEERQREKLRKDKQGYGMDTLRGEEGERRYINWDSK